MPETKFKKTEDFNEWYNEIVELADLCDKRYPIKGMNVWRPYGWKLMNHIDRLTRVEMALTDHQEVNFPLLIPESSFKKEEEHIEGFGSEVNNFDEMSCTIILLIFSVFALLGAIACLKRKHFDIAVAGCIISIFTFGFFLVGSILSIIAFVIVMKSKEEFEDGKKGKIF